MVYVQAHIMILMFVCKQCLCLLRIPPTFVYPDKEVLLYYADLARVVLNCSATGWPQPKYGWTQNGSEIQPSQFISLNSFTGVLSIDKFSATMQGLYRCIATVEFDKGSSESNKAINLSPAVQLRLIKLKFPTSSGVQSMEINPYEYMRLPCTSHKYDGPKVTYSWYYTATRLPLSDQANRIFVDKTGFVHFTFVDLSDNNINIVCGVSVWNGSATVTYYSQEYNLAVTTVDSSVEPQERPLNQYVTVNVTALRSSTAVLDCVFSGFDVTKRIPQQIWRTTSGLQIDNSTKYSVSFGGKRLTIMNVTVEDEATYYCVAANVHGESVASAHLDVVSQPVFVNGPPADVTALQGREASFTCDAVSVAGEDRAGPPVWSINGKRLGDQYDNTKFRLTMNNKKLTIVNVQRATDIICVQCVVTNNIGDAFNSACLSVALPITIVSAPPQEQWVHHGDMVNLTVIATTDPALVLKYQWGFGNETYNMNNMPRHYFRRAARMEVGIDTRLLTQAEFKAIGGVHRIEVSTVFETQLVETDVKPYETGLIPLATTTKTSIETKTVPTPESVAKSKFALSPYIIAAIIIVAVAVLLIVVKICSQKDDKTNVAEQENLHRNLHGNMKPKDTETGFDRNKDVKRRSLEPITSAPTRKTHYKFRQSTYV
ncbi:hypothetical protein BsWGS_28118 [Bradybaena similaris]